MRRSVLKSACLKERIELRHFFNGMPVTEKTASHSERMHLRDFFHPLYGFVAVFTIDSFVYVDTVIEIAVFGGFMNLLPGQGLVVFIISRQLLYLRAVNFCNCMAVHADIHRGNACVSAFVHGNVAVLAVYLQIARMELVGVVNGLVRLVAQAVPLGTGNKVGNRKSHQDNYDCDGKPCLYGVIKICFFHLIPDFINDYLFLINFHGIKLIKKMIKITIQ